MMDQAVDNALAVLAVFSDEMCKTCRYTKLMPNGRRACRRNPPGPQPPDSNSGLSFTQDDWWCGEYKPQP